jgi:3-methyladenine DNA glycosylase AlkD
MVKERSRPTRETKSAMTATEIVKQLESLGADSYKQILLNHGAREPVFGVKIEYLKKIQKPIKKDHRLALELYDTGIYDAQYLAGLIVDETKMTKQNLRRWLAKGNCTAICGTVVAWVAAESKHGREMALEWIDSKKENTAQTGWATLSGLVAIADDSELDLKELTRLLKRVEKTIHQEPDRVRYAMNHFVISLGSYVKDLTDEAVRKMGNTACQVPYAPDYIEKIRKRGAIGKKRKTVRC